MYWLLDQVFSLGAGDSSSQFGDNFSEDVGDGNVDNYACHNNGECELPCVHSKYLDPKKRNPQSAVWTPELSNRALYETDFRNITSWTQISRPLQLTANCKTYASLVLLRRSAHLPYSLINLPILPRRSIPGKVLVHAVAHQNLPRSLIAKCLQRLLYR